MKITLDLDNNEIIVPKHFYDEIAKINAQLIKVVGEGAQRIDGKDLIRKSFETAMANPDTYIKSRQ